MNRRALGFVALVGFVVLCQPLLDQDVAVFGADVPAWLVAMAFYFLGALAMFGFGRWVKEPSS
jgi:hypothetical protein